MVDRLRNYVLKMTSCVLRETSCYVKSKHITCSKIYTRGQLLAILAIKPLEQSRQNIATE